MKPLSMVALLITLSACASQKLTQTQCVVERISGFETTGNREHLTVAKNGSPCVLHLTTSQLGLRGRLVTWPAHGIGYLQDTGLQPDGSGYVTQIVYTPEHDFVGSDQFEVTFGADFNLTVLVQVVPLPNS